MPRNCISKLDLQGKIYKWKTDLFKDAYKNELSIEMKKLLLEFLEMDDNNIWNILNSSKYSKKYDSLVKLIYPIN
mgnify:CR=1 FL=1